MLPAYLIHVFLAAVRFESDLASLMVPAFDSLVVAAVSVAGGYAMFLAHKEVTASDAFGGASR